MENSRVWPDTNEMTKRGILTNGNFIKMTNLAKFTQDDKRGMSIIVGFTKMTYFASLAKESLKVRQKI